MMSPFVGPGATTRRGVPKVGFSNAYCNFVTLRGSLGSVAPELWDGEFVCVCV